MNADRLARLRRIASGGARGVTNTPAVTPEKPAITPVTPVTPIARPEAQGQPQDLARADGDPDLAQVEERAGLTADGVPALYFDAWARLNCQKPFRVGEAEWRRALDGGAVFLDAWGAWAVALGWAPGDLFDVAGGLVWQLDGARVEALGADHARLGDGRVLWIEMKLGM